MPSSVIECKQVQQIKWWYQKTPAAKWFGNEEEKKEKEMKINKRAEGRE